MATPEAGQPGPVHKTEISRFSNTGKTFELVLCDAFLKSRNIFHFSTDKDNFLFLLSTLIC